MHAFVAQEAARQAEEEARRNNAVERLRGVVTEVRVTRDRPLLEDEIKIAEDAGLDESYPVYVEALELLKELLADEALIGSMKFYSIACFLMSLSYQFSLHLHSNYCDASSTRASIFF